MWNFWDQTKNMGNHKNSKSQTVLQGEQANDKDKEEGRTIYTHWEQ